MSVSSWRRPLVTLVGLAAGAVAMACSEAITRQSDAVATAGTSPAAIAVVTTASFLTVENRAGLPLCSTSTST